MKKRVEAGVAGIAFLTASVLFAAAACGGQDPYGSETASQIVFSGYPAP